MFTTDSRTENFLTSIGVKYEYINGLMLPSEFAPGWNSENIGRPIAVREDAVIEYATLMDAGSAAPAPILYRSEIGLRVLDGVQRLSAAELAVSNEKDLPQDDEGHTTTEAELKSAIKQLRSRMRHCPMAVRRSDGVYTFDRDSFSRGWSHQSLWELGASVAMLSFFFGKVTIRSSKVIKDMEMDRAM